MRTTLTIDDEVAKLLKEEMRRSGLTLKDAVNRYLKEGLTAPKQQKRKRFVITAHPLGQPPAGLSYDNIGELLAAIEGEDHR